MKPDHTAAVLRIIHRFNLSGDADAILRRHGLTLAEAMRRCRRPRFAAARQDLWRLIRVSTPLSFTEIAELFGRDHHTVMLGVRRAERRIDETMARVFGARSGAA